jgi:antitoxin FitA
MEEEVRVILRQALAEGPEDQQGFGEKGAAPYRTANLADRLRARFAEVGGLEIELPPREMGPEPPDFSGPEYGVDDEDETPFVGGPDQNKNDG